jgi:hypothetical protein
MTFQWVSTTWATIVNNKMTIWNILRICMKVIAFLFVGDIKNPRNELEILIEFWGVSS